MTKGFYSIMLAQFLSSLADNALLIAAIALLTTLNEPAWMTPLLKLFFVVSYVIFAAWVGIFADSMPKWPRDVYHQRGKNPSAASSCCSARTLFSLTPSWVLEPLPTRRQNTAFSRSCFRRKNLVKCQRLD